MRSLFLAPSMPAESGNGLAMRMGAFLEALAALGETDVIVLPVFGYAENDSPLCRRLGIRPYIVPVLERADTHFSIVAGLADPQTRLDAFIRYAKPSLSAFLSVPVLREIQQLVEDRKYDLVHVARSYLLPAIDIWPVGKRPTISVDLDEDDVETHRRIATLYERRDDDFRARWLQAESLAFAKLIAQWLPRADLSFVATQQERDAFTRRYMVSPSVARNAVTVAPVATRQPHDRSLLFVGGFGYFPNLDAAYWLLEAVVPQVRKRAGTAVTMTMVGRNPPKRLLVMAHQAGVEILDSVDDLAPIYANASIALVPIRAGGGSRIKLLEAAAHQVPVVATTAGAENSGFEDGSEIWIADTPEAIADACLAIWKLPQEASRRTALARHLVKSRNSRPAMISAIRNDFGSHLSRMEAKL
ncbi:MAG: glycosyltransferase [Hyphomicrobiales bacterium]|nr:glycosyltransferase [Hyphomicrobiales bacterium]